MQQKNTALVTGSSSGIGFETSLLLARAGFYTYATMRNLDKSSKIIDLTKKDNLPLEVLQLDVTARLTQPVAQVLTFITPTSHNNGLELSPTSQTIA